MGQPLTIAVAQPVSLALNVTVNAVAHAELVRDAECRVMVFPELSLTGYELDAPSVEPQDERLAPLIAACAETGTVALVGAPVRDHDGLDYIATLSVTGAGAAVAYRKMYLHPPEKKRFAPGKRPVVVDVDGWRLGLAVCEDTAVPEHATATAELGMDAYVGGVLFSAANAGSREARVREISRCHPVWIALACFAGSTGGYPETSGGSGVWRPGGEVMVQAGSQPGEYVTATLDRGARVPIDGTSTFTASNVVLELRDSGKGPLP